MSLGELAGRTALITGATSAVGLATARLMAAAGAHVILSGPDVVSGKDAAKTIGGSTRFIAADLADLESVDYLARQTPVDILVNNAAVSSFCLTVDQELDAFITTYDTNVRGLYFLVAGVLPGMIRRGGGAIVNLSTTAASRGRPGASAYDASKAAVESLTRSWAAEFERHQIRVNTVATSSAEPFQPIPLAARAEAEAIAEAVAFLASPRAGFITGATVRVDGGAAAAGPDRIG